MDRELFHTVYDLRIGVFNCARHLPSACSEDGTGKDIINSEYGRRFHQYHFIDYCGDRLVQKEVMTETGINEFHQRKYLCL